MPFPRSRRATVLGLAATCLWSAAAADAPWPTAKPITWIVGFVPGGSVDVLTRAVAQELSAAIGQSIVIDNKPGASGALALNQAARAPADGYTLITVPGPVLFPRPQPQIGRELSAVALVSQGPIVLVGGAQQAPANLAELIQAMKKEPSGWSYASSGTGTGQHLAGELLNAMAGTQMVHVPYKGGGQAVTDVIGGQIGLAMLGVTPVLAHVREGRLKAYAVTTPFRIPSLPDVPTMAQAGLKGYEATQYFVAAVPKGTAPDIVQRLHDGIAKAMLGRSVQQALEVGGQVAGGLSPADTEKFVVDSLDKFRGVARDARIDLN